MKRIREKIVDLILVFASDLCDRATAKIYKNQAQLDEQFLFECQYGSLENVENFFTNKYSKFTPNINIGNGLALRRAAMSGRVDIFHFLLTSDKIAKPIEMGEHIFMCFDIARKHNRAEISTYLKQSDLFKKYLIQRIIQKEKNQLELSLEDKINKKAHFKI